MHNRLNISRKNDLNILIVDVDQLTFSSSGFVLINIVINKNTIIYFRYSSRFNYFMPNIILLMFDYVEPY